MVTALHTSEKLDDRYQHLLGEVGDVHPNSETFRLSGCGIRCESKCKKEKRFGIIYGLDDTVVSTVRNKYFDSEVGK